MGVFSLIPVSKGPRLSAYVNLGGLLSTDVEQQLRLAPITTTDVRDGECRQWARNCKSRFGGGVANSSATSTEAPAKRAKGNGKARAGWGGGDGGGGGSGASGARGATRSAVAKAGE